MKAIGTFSRIFAWQRTAVVRGSGMDGVLEENCGGCDCGEGELLVLGLVNDELCRRRRRDD